MKNIAIIGCSGAIGSAVTELLADRFPSAKIHAFSRGSAIIFTHPNIVSHTISYEHESSISEAAQTTTEDGPLDLVFIAVGVLHNHAISPEKSLSDIDLAKLSEVFNTNTFIPVLIAKHFMPKLATHKRAILVALSARVGSISDNRLGGWYAYRASKSALNMLFKTLSIEFSRKNKEGIVVNLHPGTVASELSRPFQKGVNPLKLFTPKQSAEYLLSVLTSLSADDTGKFFDWAGNEIPY